MKTASPDASAPPATGIAVVIAASNEALTLPLILERVLAQPLVRQVIVVDDASQDDTSSILKSWQARDPRLIVHRHPRNRGKGAALRTGFAEATAPLVVIQDADLEYDPADYALLCEPILSGRADVVFGSRFKGSGRRRVPYFWHHVANGVLTRLSNLFTHFHLSDMECGAKAFRLETLRRLDLREEGFGIEPELVMKVARLGIGTRVAEVGVSYHGRTYAEGKKIRGRDGLRAVGCLVRYGLRP